MATKKSKSAAPKSTATAADTGDLSLEQKKAAGLTSAQQELRAYHEGAFQTQDPITGEDRDLDETIRVARLDRGETVETVSPTEDDA